MTTECHLLHTRRMPTSTLGPPVRTPPPSRERSAVVYWRRRVGALAVGVAVLAVVAWAFEGAMGGGASPSAAGPAAGSRPAASHPVQTTPPVPGHTVTPGQHRAAGGPFRHCLPA